MIVTRPIIARRTYAHRTREDKTVKHDDRRTHTHAHAHTHTHTHTHTRTYARECQELIHTRVYERVYARLTNECKQTEIVK